MSSLRCQVPAKALLFGEWAVLDGAPALGTTLNSWMHFSLEKIEKSNQAFEFQSYLGLWHPGEKLEKFQWLERSLTKLVQVFQLDIEQLRGLRLKVTSDWNVQEGLGSSSALFAGLYMLLKTVSENRENSNSDLQLIENFKAEVHAVSACQALIECLDGLGSGADILTQMTGGAVRIEDGQTQALNLSLPGELCLLHTGEKISTEEQIRINPLSPQGRRKIADLTENFFAKENWVECIRGHLKVLSESAHCPATIHNEIQYAIDNNLCQAGKTTGAGGGDALLFWVERSQYPKFQKWFLEKNWWKSYPFSKSGATFIQ